MPVKLQHVQRNYRVRNHFGMRVSSMTPRSKLLKQGQLKQSLNQPSVYCLKSLGIDCGSKKLSNGDVFCEF